MKLTPRPTESQFRLLEKIARRAETGCQMRFREFQPGSSDTRSVLDANCAGFVFWINGTHTVHLTSTGQSALAARIVTKECWADGCEELVEYKIDDEDEADSYCSERCEEMQRCRDRAEDLMDAQKEGM
jgi:hypothetical protein